MFAFPFLAHGENLGHCAAKKPITLSQRNYEYSPKTLNIDCCVLTRSLNEIKTNINHMLARQQTLLDP